MDIRDWIYSFIRERGMSPTITEVAKKFDVTKPTAHELVDEVVARGWLIKIPRKHRGLRIPSEADAEKKPFMLYHLEKPTTEPGEWAGIGVSVDTNLYPIRAETGDFFVRMGYRESTALNLRINAILLVRPLNAKNKTLTRRWCLVRYNGITVVRKTSREQKWIYNPKGQLAEKFTLSKNRARTTHAEEFIGVNSVQIIGTIISITGTIGTEFGDFLTRPPVA